METGVRPGVRGFGWALREEVRSGKWGRQNRDWICPAWRLKMTDAQFSSHLPCPEPGHCPRLVDPLELHREESNWHLAWSEGLCTGTEGSKDLIPE